MSSPTSLPLLQMTRSTQFSRQLWAVLPLASQARPVPASSDELEPDESDTDSADEATGSQSTNR